ncbi:hypothetical protein AB0L86_12215 [Micromonospora musae]|uniref:hypothetical protein n=1 Tax=Micromonospora musae TaxID=1894970 RepID=UPI00342E0C60
MISSSADCERGRPGPCVDLPEGLECGVEVGARDGSRMTAGVKDAARRCARILVAVTLLLAACGSEEPGPSRRLGSTDTAQIGDIAWNRDGRLFALYTHGSDSDFGLAEFTDGGDLRPVEVLPGGFCARPAFFDLATLPDGGLGAVVTCDEGDERFAVRIDGQQLVRLASLGANRLIKWNPDMRTGWLELVTGYCRAVGLFQNGEALPFPPYHPSDVLEMDLQAAFTKGKTCAESGRAGFADVAGDGKLYLLASDSARGRFEKPDAPWQPLVFDPRSGQLRKFGPELTSPYALAVVPRSDSVVVTGAKGWRKGAWLVSSEDGKAQLIAAGDLYAVAAAFDGSRVAVVHSVGGRDEVLEVKVK